MRTRVVTVAILLIIIAACESKPKPPPTPVVVPPTPTEIAQKIIADSFLNNVLPPSDFLRPQRGVQISKDLRTAMALHASTPGGREAMDIVAASIDRQISGVLRSKFWAHVVLYCEAYEILNPGSPKYTATKADAMVELAKPVISKIQIITDHESGLTTILADIYLPLEGISLESERLYVGDERPDLNLAILSLIGRDRGIRVQYLENGDEWDVYR